jgi:hypothetical protein
MAAIYSNGGNRWNILGFNYFSKRDELSSLYKISMELRDNAAIRIFMFLSIKTIYFENMLVKPSFLFRLK